MGVLRKSRAIEGVTQWEMAERVGKSVTAISSYENNEERVPMAIYRRWYSQLQEEAARRFFLDELIGTFV